MRIAPSLAAAALMSAVVPAPVLAQVPAQVQVQAQPAPAMPVFAASAQVQALIANARRAHPAGQPTFSQTIVGLAPYRANLEHRTAVGPAAVHDKEAELFYVLEGSGTLVTGGKLTQESQPSPDNRSGAGVDGGQARAVAKGDLFIVPEGTPHWFSRIDGELILVSLHLPRG